MEFWGHLWGSSISGEIRVKHPAVTPPKDVPPHDLPTLTILACQRPICQLPCALGMEEGPDLGRPGCLVQDFSFLRWRLPLQKKEH